MEMPDLLEEEHLRRRGVWLDWQTAQGEQFKGLGVFPRFDQHPGRVWRPMPDQGADSCDVLTRLGYSAAEITALIATGVVKQSI
jgi:L-carnitine CoA-transferase